MLAATTAKFFSLIDNATSIVFQTSPKFVERNHSHYLSNRQDTSELLKKYIWNKPNRSFRMILAIKVIRVLLFVIVVLLFASSMPIFAGITLLFIFGLSKLLKKID